MKNPLFIALISSLVFSCQEKNNTTQNVSSMDIPKMSEEFLSNLQWINEPESFQMADSMISITADKGTDFFNNPMDNSISATAPYLYETIEGDFVAKAFVEPDFSSQWNAVSLFLHIDSLHWIKLAFENSDATGPSIVTVVTNGTSDDSNGPIMNGEKQIWLAVARKNNIYSLHWSKDGENYKMARLTSMPITPQVKIGIEAQCPVGEKTKHKIYFFGIEKRSVEDMRNLD